MISGAQKKTTNKKFFLRKVFFIKLATNGHWLRRECWPTKTAFAGRLKSFSRHFSLHNSTWLTESVSVTLNRTSSFFIFLAFLFNSFKSTRIPFPFLSFPSSILFLCVKGVEGSGLSLSLFSLKLPQSAGTTLSIRDCDSAVHRILVTWSQRTCRGWSACR